MSLNYSIVSVQPSADTVCRIIRDDVNGSIIEISSSGLAARVTVRDLVSEINRLVEIEKAMKAAPAPLEDGVNE